MVKLKSKDGKLSIKNKKRVKGGGLDFSRKGIIKYSGSDDGTIVPVEEVVKEVVDCMRSIPTKKSVPKPKTRQLPKATDVAEDQQGNKQPIDKTPKPKVMAVAKPSEAPTNVVTPKKPKKSVKVSGRKCRLE